MIALMLASALISSAHPLVAAARRPYVPAVANVTVIPQAAPDNPGELAGPSAYYPATNTIYLTPGSSRFDRAHEYGHAFDQQALTDADRLSFQRLLRAGNGVWNQGTGTRGYGSPNEAFADYYAAAATNLNPRHENVMDYVQIEPRILRRFETALAVLGRQRGLAAYV